jgi:hypothetical protein
MGAMPEDFLPDDLDSILQLLAHTEKKWSDLAALHGNFGKYTDMRKIELAKAKLKIRAADLLPPGFTKWTDDVLEAASHAETQYVAWVEKATEDAKLFHALSEERDRMHTKAKALAYSPVR